MSQNDWEKEWKNMPEYVNEKITPYHSLVVKFRNQEDYVAFAKLVGQNVTDKTKSMWYPPHIKGFEAHLRYVDEA